MAQAEDDQAARENSDDPKWNELDTHFNVWTFGGIVVVALIICYFTNTYPWINGVFKL